MSNQKRSILGKESLERLSSSKKLNQLMQVVKPKSWLPIFALGSVVGVTLTWGIFGTIPVIIEGRGVIIYPTNIIPLKPQSAGQLMMLNIKAGDVVKKGQILARIDQTEVRKQLQQQQAKLKALETQRQSIEEKKSNIYLQSQYLWQRMEELQLVSPLLQVAGSTPTQQRLQQTQGLTPMFQRRMESRKQLFQKEGAISGNEALEAEREYLQNLEKNSDFKPQLSDLNFQETPQTKDYRENLTIISNLQVQVQELINEQAFITQQELESETIRKKQIQDVQREIIRLEMLLNTNSQIISQYSGRILEVTATLGQVVSPSSSLATIEAEYSQNKLVGVTYFPIKEGRKIQPGMSIQITPQNVKHNFGGILGTVTNISTLPITKAATVSKVANPGIIESLLGQQPKEMIQVVSELQLDPNTPSGYKWSFSQGPNLQISSGTTTVVRAKVQERTAMSLVLPMF
ncbi:secretion protein HlyD (plasmid) [Nostoc sp. NIES-2111]|nr:secretion protein HlyD [Nostoc sp. NIES-2111]